jgi:tryptophan synthase beta chain
MKTFKVFLREDEVPRQWYNIQADLPTPLQPIIHPATGKPIGPEDLAPVFPMNLIEQEVSHQRWIDIPEEVLEKLLIWRPSPLQRAYALEKA